MIEENLITPLYERLDQSGLKRNYVKKRVLPEWWSDSIARNPVGYLQALGYVSKHLGIPIDQLRREDDLKVEDSWSTKFKVRQNLSKEELTWAKSLSVRVAQMASHAFSQPLKDIPQPASIRDSLLSGGGAWLSFEMLLDYCWSVGVPVLHVSHFPQGSKKMDGMAVSVDGRPVIVLSKRHKHEAWLSFILAHELGHIASGHLADDEVLVDGKVDLSDSETEEKEANDFARKLIADGRQFNASHPPKAEVLARRAQATVRECKVSPGAVVLNYVWGLSRKSSNSYYPLANRTLNILYPDPDDPVDLVHRKMLEHLNLDVLPQESQAFLRRVTGADEMTDAASIA